MSEIQVGQINSTDGSTAITVSTGNTTLAGSLAMGANNISFSNGNGIDFSASEGSGADSSVLDDYEEGTWTPTYEATSSNPTITYNSQTGGTYQKIGRTVFVTGRIRTDSASGGSGNLAIGGLPFAVTSGVDGTAATQETTGVMAVGQSEGFSGNHPKFIDVGTSGLTVFTADDSNFQTSALNTAITAANLSSSGNNRIRFAGFYLTDS